MLINNTKENSILIDLKDRPNLKSDKDVRVREALRNCAQIQIWWTLAINTKHGCFNILQIIIQMVKVLIGCWKD